MRSQLSELYACLPLMQQVLCKEHNLGGARRRLLPSASDLSVPGSDRIVQAEQKYTGSHAQVLVIQPARDVVGECQADAAGVRI